jgi:hypothetical protein
MSIGLSFRDLTITIVFNNYCTCYHDIILLPQNFIILVYIVT